MSAAYRAPQLYSHDEEDIEEWEAREDGSECNGLTPAHSVT